jgi:CDP-glucose 4,6-dehydratase
VQAPRVLVTGAYGRVGRWVVESALQAGWDVTVLRRGPDRDSALRRDGLEEHCRVVAGDVCADADVAGAMRGADVVLHLAAQAIRDAAVRDPGAAFRTNVLGTVVVLEAALRREAGAVVVAGSVNAYGPSDDLPYTEDHPLRPTAPYDASKAAADLVARSYARSFGLPVATTRFANLYGGGDLNRSRLVPGAVAAALAGRAPVIRSDGTPQRDFLHAADAAAAYLAIARALLDGRPGALGEAFNAGGDRTHAVLEVVEAVCRVAGADVVPDVRGTGTPAGEADRQWVDSSRLRALTGWRPTLTLEEGLARTVAWYRSHPGVLG